jgi:hypothetical protein
MNITQPKNEIFTYRKMDGSKDHHVEQNKPSSKSHILHFHSFVETKPKVLMMMIMGHECKREMVGGSAGR